MSINQILDLSLVVVSVALTAIVAIYAKYKIEIDRKAQQGNQLAKAEQIVAKSVAPLVYQAEKEGGDGAEKFTQVLNGILMLLDLAHLPHPTSQYLSGEIEKSVTAMKQTQGLIDTFDGNQINAKPEQQIVAKTETTAKKEQ